MLPSCHDKTNQRFQSASQCHLTETLLWTTYPHHRHHYQHPRIPTAASTTLFSRPTQTCLPEKKKILVYDLDDFSKTVWMPEVDSEGRGVLPVQIIYLYSAGSVVRASAVSLHVPGQLVRVANLVLHFGLIGDLMHYCQQSRWMGSARYSGRHFRSSFPVLLNSFPMYTNFSPTLLNFFHISSPFFHSLELLCEPFLFPCIS